MARGGRAGVYAVARGRAVGVFDTWAEAEAMVVGYQGARFKKFGSPADARAFVAANAAQRQAGAGRSVRPAPAAGGIGRLAPYPVHGIANPGLVPAAPVRPGAALSPPTGSNPAGAAAPPPAPSAPPPEEAHDDEDDDGGGAVAALPSAPPLPADPPTQAAAPSASGGAVPRAHFFLFFDGASKGNPGPSGAGAYLLETESQEIRWRQSCGLPNGTNNEAEYHGLLIGLEQAVTMPHVTRLTVIGDSELVIKQMLGVYRVRASTLVGLHARAKDLCNRLRARRCRLSFRHIDRCLNALADSLANDGVQW